MWEPKPHLVAFVASMVLIAGVSTAVEHDGTAGDVGITIDDPLAQGEDGTDDGLALGGDASGGGADGGLAGEGLEDTGTTVPGGSATNAGGGSTTDGSGGAATGSSGSGSSGSGSSGSGSSTSPSGGGSTTAPTTPPAAAAPSWPDAKLYTGAAATRGITKNEIVMCGHAALALGAAFDTSREDLNVYWDNLNANGGVRGRNVKMSWEDDAYVSDAAVRAATTCADKDPFMILGGIGFDQIPGVRTWAEANDELYLHHIAVAPTQTYDYSFSLSPTVQLVGLESGNYIAKKHRTEKVGVIYRSTANWQPGSDAGMKVMTDKKMDVTGYPIVQNQGVYAQELNAMKLNGTKVVWVWENALNAAQIINQASEIEYYPTWVVFPFQTTIDILNEPTKHTIEGVASWGSYAKGGYGNDWSQFGLAAEIKAFEAAYAKYRPGTTPNDILWQVWVGNKILAQMLSDCGQDCNRNRFAGMMLSGYRTTVNPGCPVDFRDSRSFGGHHGGFRFFTQELFKPKSGPAYRTTAYCATTLK